MMMQWLVIDDFITDVMNDVTLCNEVDSRMCDVIDEIVCD